MGEETDIAEPLSSDDVKAAGGTANTPSNNSKSRKRKNNLYKSIQTLMEFYLGDANLRKNRFMFEKIQGQPFVYVDLSLFLTFNKMKLLTSNADDLAKAVSQSEMLKLSKDGTQVCRTKPIYEKEDEDDCTIYVEQLGPDVDQDLLTKIFSEYGPVDYVSVPRFAHNNKNKGFAFVEFQKKESAKKALEAFNARGCCLSPHMAPEELMSIKNFDKNKENKSKDNAPESEEGENQETSGETDQAGKGKNKRTASDPQSSSSKKKLKNDDSNDKEVACKKGKKVDKLKADSKNSTGNKESPGDKLQKRKRSVSNEHETEKEEVRPPEKKLKSDSEDVTEPEMSHTEDDTENEKTPKDSKKKRMRKKVKKDKSPAISLGLKVLTKKEWKKLRNNYLNMQKNTMRSLKQQLSYSKRERNRLAPVERKKGVKQEKRQSGTVIKITLDEPVTNISSTKSDMRVHPDIKYVDVTEGNPCVYLRTSTPELASSLIQSKHWPKMEVIQGDEEAVYWSKMEMDREEHLKKNKQSQRGRSKLLKRAERFQGKHITTIEAS